MRRISAFIFMVLYCAGVARGQDTPGMVKSPAGLVTQDSLFRVRDDARTTLSTGITASSTSITVASTSSFDPTGSLVIDNEIIFYTSKTATTFDGLTRGASSTAAASHSSGARVRGAIFAARHTTRSSAFKTQEKLGAGASVPSAGAVLAETGAGISGYAASPSVTALNASGAVPARTFVGDGSGLTGIGSGTGGIINTGSTTVRADSDSDEVGVIDLQTRAQMPLRVGNDGSLTGFGPFAGELRDKGGQVYNVRAYGAALNGTTDDAGAIQGRIDAANTAGGGRVLIPAGATAAIASTITLKNNVVVELGPGATIKWTGAAGGTMFTSSTADPLLKSGVVGAPSKIDPNGTAGYVFNLHSPQFCQFKRLDIEGMRATGTVFNLAADATNATGYQAKANVMFNSIEDITGFEGPYGTVLRMSGPSGSSVVTLNQIGNLNFSDIRVKGISLVQWTDNNVFTGEIVLQLLANDAVGLVVNDSATPSANVGVYGNHFDMLAVDTFASGHTGRKGMVLNHSKYTVIKEFHQDPAAEGGSIVDNYSESHYILQAGTTSQSGLRAIQKNFSVGGYTHYAPLVNLSLFKRPAFGGIALDGNNDIEFLTSGAASGHGFRLQGVDPGGGVTDLRISARANAASFSDFLYFTDNGRVGFQKATPNSSVEFGGSVGYAVRTVTATGTLTGNDYVIIVNAGAPTTQNLPTAVGITGRVYTVKNRTANAVTVDPSGAETIDGAATYSLGSANKYVTVISNGANWFVIANN